MMKTRERVLTALEHKEPDRVPSSYCLPQKVADRMKEYYQVEDNLSLYEAMDIDAFSIDAETYVFPEHVGPNPYELPYVNYMNFWGFGGTMKHRPLERIDSIKALDDYCWPQADWFSYDHVEEECRKTHALGLPTVGGEGGCGLQHCVHLRGYNNALMDPYTPGFPG